MPIMKSTTVAPLYRMLSGRTSSLRICSGGVSEQIRIVCGDRRVRIGCNKWGRALYRDLITKLLRWRMDNEHMFYQRRTPYPSISKCPHFVSWLSLPQLLCAATLLKNAAYLTRCLPPKYVTQIDCLFYWACRVQIFVLQIFALVWLLGAIYAIHAWIEVGGIKSIETRILPFVQYVERVRLAERSESRTVLFRITNLVTFERGARGFALQNGSLYVDRGKRSKDYLMRCPALRLDSSLLHCYWHRAAN